MKRKISATAVMLAALFLIGAAAAVRAKILHARYPDPEIFTYEYGDSPRIGGYSITFSGWQWGEEALIEDRFPDYVLFYEDETGENREAVRVGLVGLTVQKAEKEAEPLDLTRFSFSSGGWGNQFDMELFYLLNPEGVSLKLDLSGGETKEIWLPMIMRESNFTAAQWEEVDQRDFYLNVQYYPEHIRFVCPR